MASELLRDLSRASDSNNDPLSGATWNFYAYGTLTPQAVYSDDTLATSLGATVTADAGGKFVPIYFDTSLQYRGILKDASGTTIQDIPRINDGFASRLATDDLVLTIPRPFESFLADDYDYTADDCSTELETAWTWSVTSNRPVSFAKRYRIANTPVLTGAGNFHFTNARFDLLDTGATGEVFTGTNVLCGMLFKQVDGARLTGTASLVGSGTTLGTTRLSGAMFYDSDGLQMLAVLHFENMGEGMIASYCTNSVFADVSGKNLYGTQPFTGTGTSGTVQVIYGCEDCQFGNAHGEQIFKPVRYMSLGANAAAATTSNARLQIGSTSGTGRDSSAESSILSIRCAKDCNFGPVTGGNVSCGLFVIRYTGDSSYSLDGNTIDSVRVDSINSAASADAIVSVTTESPTIGFNRIGIISGTGAVYGVLLQAGDTEIGSLDVDAPLPFEVSAGAKFDIGLAKITGFSTHGFTYSAVTGRIRELQINSGTTGAAATYHGVFNADTSASSQIVIGKLVYAQNGVGNNLAYVFVDTYSSPSQVRVDDIVGTGATGLAIMLAGLFPAKVRTGRILATAAPTTGTWAVGDIVYNSAPASGGTWGWVCVTAGTPGTWAVIGVPGMAQAAAPSTTYAAPSGGATVDTEGRASLAQLAADVADLKTKLATAKVTA